jgi:hypothetical protein
MIDMINMIVILCAAWRQNLECGDKSRAVRGSRHRFLSAPYAETHLVSTPSRLPQRRSVGTKRNRRSVSTKRALRFLVLSTDLRRFFFFVFDRRMGGTSVCSSAGKQTLAPPGAPRAWMPYTFTAQRFACMGGSAHETRARCPCHTSAPLRLCIKKTLNFLRAGTSALPTAYTQNTHSTRMLPVANRLFVNRLTREGGNCCG